MFRMLLRMESRRIIMVKLITIECLDCDENKGETWAFDNVPDNKLSRDLIRTHELKYGHKVVVK